MNMISVDGWFGLVWLAPYLRHCFLHGPTFIYQRIKVQSIASLFLRADRPIAHLYTYFTILANDN